MIQTIVRKHHLDGTKFFFSYMYLAYKGEYIHEISCLRFSDCYDLHELYKMVKKFILSRLLLHAAKSKIFSVK